MAKSVKLSMGCGYVLFFFLLAGGLFFLAGAALQARDGYGVNTAQVLAPGGLGLALVLGAFGYLRLARRLVAESKAEEARRAAFPDEPWKWKKQWSGGAIDADGHSGARVFWVFVIVWNAASWAGIAALLRQGFREPAQYLIWIFPLAGVGMLWAAVYQQVQQRKYGRARFVPSSLPGVIGGYLGGLIEVPGRVIPEGHARLSLKCVRRETRGSGKNRRTTDNVLWEREELIPREKWVSGLGGTRIPVLFYIPPECGPTDDSDRNNEVVWRLRTEAETEGVDFATQFVVPVFATGQTAAPPAPGAPLLEEYEVLTLDAAALRACGVTQEGNAFEFTARHMPGTRFTFGILFGAMIGLLVWYAGNEVHGAAWGITIVFALIFGAFGASVWFSRYRLRVEATEVVVTKPRPWGTSVTRVPRGEVVAVKPAKAMSSGENQYFSLSLVGAPGSNSGQAVSGNEPFRVRKLRRQLEQSKQSGGLSPTEEQRLTAEIADELSRQPRFEVTFARHIPGQGRAEAISSLVLGAIRGK